MKKSKTIIFATLGGMLGFAIHLTWHSREGINLFSIGPHAIQGVVYTLIGISLGAILSLIIYKITLTKN